MTVRCDVSYVPSYVAPVDGSPSETIVDAVATHSDCSALDLVPLQRCIDMEALDELVTSTTDVTIELEYAEYRVVVDATRVCLYD